MLCLVQLRSQPFSGQSCTFFFFLESPFYVCSTCRILVSFVFPAVLGTCCECTLMIAEWFDVIRHVRFRTSESSSVKSSGKFDD